ncbi:hypothetical protein [Pontibacter populi]|uniref:Uncharacterized protein n=1 Tax=Pontibacter populi TaxID=890055 RepID=A0ABV1RRW7_9BACT
MNFHPPIEERGSDELIEIANFPDKWQVEAVIQAKLELERRGISSLEQEKKVEKLNRDYQAELKCEMKKRALVKYNPIEMFFMFLRLPATILFGWNLKRDGYKRMHEQRIWIIFLGLLFYVSSIMYVIINTHLTEKERLKLIQEQDISEWEKSYYGDGDDSTQTEKTNR